MPLFLAFTSQKIARITEVMSKNTHIKEENMAETKKKRKWLRKTFKWLIGIIVVLLLLAITAVYYLYNHWDWQSKVRELVHVHGSAAVGTSVNIGRINLSLTDGKGGVGHITVANPKGYSQDYILELDGVSVAVDKNSVTKLAKELAQGTGPKVKTVVINEIRVDKPAVTYELMNLKQNNVDDLMAGIKKNTASPAKAEPAKADGVTYNVAIKKVVVANGQATVAASLLGVSQSLSLPLPTVTINNLGTEKQGITIEEGIARVFMEILKTTRNVVANADLSGLLGGVGNLAGATAGAVVDGAGAAVDGAGKAAGAAVDGVKSLTGSVGGLFKK